MNRTSATAIWKYSRSGSQIQSSFEYIFVGSIPTVEWPLGAHGDVEVVGQPIGWGAHGYIISAHGARRILRMFDMIVTMTKRVQGRGAYKKAVVPFPL